MAEKGQRAAPAPLPSRPREGPVDKRTLQAKSKIYQLTEIFQLEKDSDRNNSSNR
jgi:hypothetical protein